MKKLEVLRPIIVVLVLVVSIKGFSQKPLKNFNDSTSKTAYVVNTGDSIAVQVDSTMIMNKVTFNLYNSYYLRGRSASSSYRGVLNYYEDIIRKQDSMLLEKEGYYKQLNSNFQTLSGSTKAFIDQTGNSLQTVSTALGKAQTQLTDTQALLTEAQKLLAAERRRSNLKALKFGIGGVLIGGILGALIVH